MTPTATRRTRFAARLGRAATPLAVFYVVLWASAYVPSKIGAVAAPPLWFLFGLAFGAAFLDEAIGPFDALGLVAVALGILLVQRA